MTNTQNDKVINNRRSVLIEEEKDFEVNELSDGHGRGPNAYGTKSVN